MTLDKKTFENIVGKGENAGNQHFLFLPQCFFMSQNKLKFFSHVYFVVCKCFQFDQCKNLSFGKELIFKCIYTGFLAHLSTKCLASCCDHPMSIVRQQYL